MAGKVPTACDAYPRGNEEYRGVGIGRIGESA